MLSLSTLELLKAVTTNTPATPDLIAAVESELTAKLPSDYRDVLLYSNGFEGAVGSEGWLQLWPTQDIVDFNFAAEYPVNLPGVIAIGSNGGGFDYGIDLRHELPRYVMFDPISPQKDIFDGGATFEELLVRISKGTLDRISY
jgi:hypothetical protein